MAELRSMDALIAEVTTNVQNEVLSELRPIFERLAGVIGEIEAALGGGRSRPSPKAAPAAPAASAGGKKRGRPPGRPAAAAATAAPAAATRGAKRGPVGGGDKNPRGALQQVMRKVLEGAGSPLMLRDIHSRVLADPQFKGRNPKAVYTQIILNIKRMEDVNKGAKGYTLKRAK